MPHVDEWEKAELFPREIFQALWRAGLPRRALPRGAGGAGGDKGDFWYSAAWAEALVHGRCAGLAMSPRPERHGDADHRRAGHARAEGRVPAAGPARRKIASLGVSEPNHGSDVASISTTARRVGDEYVINGAKCWITNGTAPTSSPWRCARAPGLGLWRHLAGAVPHRRQRLQGHAQDQKIGNHASDTAELSFKTAASRALPARRRERRLLLHHDELPGRAAGRCPGAVAGAQQVLDETVRYTSERQAFGRPILKFQVWRHTFAELATQIEAARWLAIAPPTCLTAREEAVKEITMAKLFAGEVACKVADRCLQAHGGFGYAEEFPGVALLPRYSPHHHRRRHQRDHERDHLEAPGLGLGRAAARRRRLQRSPPRRLSSPGVVRRPSAEHRRQ